jgi:queuine/archaeosine tRNA-ribosyltransferase
MEILLVLVVGAMCIGCFVTGAKVGQAVTNGEKIETPTLNPLEAYKKHRANKEAEMEQDRVKAILRNIDSYDGTGNRQEDVPRG